MTKNNRIIVVVLVILNSVVLLGQLWPEGVPPFAMTVNVLTLILNLLFLVMLLIKKK